MMVVLIILGLWAAVELGFYITHRRPLSREEIRLLSQKRKRLYISRTYNHFASECEVSKSFKSSMDPSGKMYAVNLPLNKFPAYVAALLKGKKHEWILIAMEGQQTVKFFWVNKGYNNSSVSYNCDIDDVILFCKEQNCNTLMCFHNHPNSNPRRYNCLVASKQDIYSAFCISNKVIPQGLNWIEFVCERGNFLKYFERYSDKFLPDCANIEAIESENNISPRNNYILHREIGILSRIFRT